MLNIYLKITQKTFHRCLDEGIEFTKKVQKLGVDVHFDILHGLNHGFLNYAMVLDFQLISIFKLNTFILDVKREPRGIADMYESPSRPVATKAS